MAILYLSKGLPGSGKSTAARRFIEFSTKKIIRANRDEIRYMLYGVYFGPPIDENVVTFVQASIIRDALTAGYDAYADDTNLSPKAVETMEELARETGSFIVWHDHTDVPLSVCIERDDHRAHLGERSTGAQVIRDMYERYLA